MPEHLWRLDWHPAHRELVLAEARALGAGAQLAPGLFGSDRPYPAGRLAYGLGGGRVLGMGTPDALRAQAPLDPGTRVHVPKGPFKPAGSPLETLARLGPGLIHAPRGTPLELFGAGERWVLIERAPSPAFQAPELPYRSSTSTSSQLARAVINLIARPGDRVLDPVCGTGSLLVEAARIGCAVWGSDRNAKACHMARANLRAAGVCGTVTVREALTGEHEPADVLVADLPYGRRLAESELRPLACALAAHAGRWALIAHEDLSEALAAAGTPPTRRVSVPKPTFTLTRTILLRDPASP